MIQRFQAIKGMPDILPEDTLLWQQFERLWRQLMWNYGYDEIRFPIVEATGLFKRSIGEVTDIVEKEMFTFTDKDNESITMRPEGTAGCVRAGIENGLLYNQIQRLWYMGPMFRYEKPQKGRYRQFHHAGVEAFGLKGPDIEVEQVLLIKRLWQWLGIQDAIKLEINSIGSEETRKSYRSALVDYLTKYRADLDDDSKRRLETNPMRILDSKNPQLAAIIDEAPKSYDFLQGEDKVHFEEFQRQLKEAGVQFNLNPRIVRGLDYYNRTVYEWVTQELGAQGAVCAGGRYDSLVEQLGGAATPAVGFGLGIERAILLVDKLKGKAQQTVDVYVIAVGDHANAKVMSLIEKLRNQIEKLSNESPNLRILVNAGGGSFKNQFKRADKSGAQIALILGDDELAKEEFGVKFLRKGENEEEKGQQAISFKEIGSFLNQTCKTKIVNPVF